MGHLRSGLHPGLTYWLHKIVCAVDTICRKCRVGKETAKHVYDCPLVHHLPHEPATPDTSERSTKGSANMGKVYLRPRPTCLSQESPPPNLPIQPLTIPPIRPSHRMLHNAILPSFLPHVTPILPDCSACLLNNNNSSNRCNTTTATTTTTTAVQISLPCD